MNFHLRCARLTRLFIIFQVFVCLFSFAHCHFGFAIESASPSPELKILRPEKKKDRIKGLEVSEVKLTRPDRNLAEGEWDQAVLSGTFNQKTSVLLYEKTVIAKGSGIPVPFQVTVPLTGEYSKIGVYLVDDEGEMKKEEWIIENTLWKKIVMEREKQRLLNQVHNFSISVGPSLIYYNQSYYSSFQAWMATLKIGYLNKHSERIDFGISSFANLYPLTKSSQNVTVRYFGLNLRAGYRIISKAGWIVRLMTGAYYLRTFVTGSDFGIKEMAGPQVFPMIAHILGNGHSVYAYGKYSPMFYGLGFQPMGNRELAAGTGYRMPLTGNNKALVFSFDYSNIHIESKSRIGRGHSLSLAIGYEF